MVAFIWRLVLTTGTGSIFGFLVARDAYNSAILAPMFIIMSLSFGLAIFLLVLLAAARGTGRAIGGEILDRLRVLLAVFVACVLYFAAIQHLTNAYIARQHEVVRFFLVDGGIYTALFWIGQVGVGGVVPLVLLLAPAFRKSRPMLALASACVVAGW